MFFQLSLVRGCEIRFAVRDILGMSRWMLVGECDGAFLLFWRSFFFSGSCSSSFLLLLAFPLSLSVLFVVICTFGSLWG